MTGDQDYAAALLLAAEPTDRALAGWGGNPAEWAAWHLRGEARRQAARDDLHRTQLTEGTTP